MDKVLRALALQSYDVALAAAARGNVCPRTLPWGERQFGNAIRDNPYGWARYMIFCHGLRDQETRKWVRGAVMRHRIEHGIWTGLGVACLSTSVIGTVGSFMVISDLKEAFFATGVTSLCGYGATQLQVDRCSPYAQLQKHITDIELRHALQEEERHK
jgi:hypothetical protein